MSSFSSSSIVHKTGALLGEYPYEHRPFFRSESYRLKKQTYVHVLRTDRDVPGTPSLRFRCAMSVIEIGLFGDGTPRVSGPNRQRIEKQRRSWRPLSSLLLLLK